MKKKTVTPARRMTDKFNSEAYDTLTKLYVEISTISREHPGSNKNGAWIKHTKINKNHYLS